MIDSRAMYTAVGELNESTLKALKKALPRCYEENFECCLDDANRHKPSCKKFEAVHQAYDQDHDATLTIIKGTTRQVAMAGGGGLLVGALLGALLF